MECAPPIDTKFEATFGTRGRPCSGVSSKDCDFVDVSLAPKAFKVGLRPLEDVGDLFLERSDRII